MFSFFQQFTLEQYIEKESSRFLKGFPHARLGIGIYQSGKRTIKYFGKDDFTKSPIFEIGSITKIFTNIILSYFLQIWKITLDSTLNDILGNKYTVSSFLQSITLADLSTHTSGIPSFPDGWVNNLEEFESFPKRFNKDEFLKYLKEPGNLKKKGSFEYSNLGIGILWFCLEEISGKTLDELFQEHIFSCLHMIHSGVSIEWNLSWYDSLGEEKSYIDWWTNILVGAWWIRSNIEDMLQFIEWNFQDILYIKTPQERIPWKNTWLGWMMPTFIDKLFGNKHIIWHDWATPGFASYISIDRENKNGIILLCNQNLTLNFLWILFMKKIRKNAII